MTHSEAALQYAEDVIGGKIPACRFVELACKRFVKDLKNKKWPYRYDSEKADRACSFLEKLPHTKGYWARKKEKLVLGGWQKFIVCNLFGWVEKETGFRRFRDAYNELPRKNGKSFLAAGIGLYMFAADDEYGAEVYSGATSEQQAWKVFEPARLICLRTPALRSKFDIEVNAKTLTIPSNGSKFEPIIGNPGDGGSPSCAIVDEFHEHKTSDLADTMDTGMGARQQPLMFYITTAGSDFGGPCYEKRADAIRVLEDTVQDETFFAIIYGIDEKDEWDTTEALIKANPNYGISVNPAYLEGKLKQARRSATAQNKFKTKHLNQWVGAKTAWMNMLALRRCVKPKLEIEQHQGEECLVGLDLASKIDIASMSAVFPKPGGKYATFCKHYLPEEAVHNGKNDKYLAWSEQGLITTTPGEIIDFEYIEDDLKEFAANHNVTAVGYDPYQATQFVTRMTEEGLTMVEVAPTVRNFSEVMKELEALIIAKKFEYNGDAVLTWMFGNVVAKLDKKDNIYPNKEKPENKIDGVIATLMGLKMALRPNEDENPYADRGILISG